MKHLKILALGTVAALALAAFIASGASATTLEVGGVVQNSSVKIEASVASGTSMVLSRTDGSLANTCTTSNVTASTVSPYSTEDVGGPISTLTFESCTRPVTVHKAGAVTLRRIAGTRDLTVFWGEGEVTVNTPFGTVNCKPGVHTHWGRITKLSPRSIWHVSIVLNCGFLLPSAVWKGSYEITSPAELGGVE